MRAATFATSSRCQEIPSDESCRLAVGSLNGPLTVPSRCTLPRGASSAWPHHFAAFWSSLSLTTRTSIDGCCLMSASMPSITPRSSGALNSRFSNCRSRPSNEMSLWSVSMRVLVEPIVRSSGASSARPPARRQVNRERWCAERDVRGLVSVLDGQSRHVDSRDRQAALDRRFHLPTTSEDSSSRRRGARCARLRS